MKLRTVLDIDLSVCPCPTWQGDSTWLTVQNNANVTLLRKHETSPRVAVRLPHKGWWYPDLSGTAEEILGLFQEIRRIEEFIQSKIFAPMRAAELAKYLLGNPGEHRVDRIPLVGAPTTQQEESSRILYFKWEPEQGSFQYRSDTGPWVDTCLGRYDYRVFT